MSVTTLILAIIAILLVGLAVALARRADRRREALLESQRRAAQFRAVLDAVPRRSLGLEVGRLFLTELVRHLNACRAGGLFDADARVLLDEARRGLETLEKDVAAADPSPANEPDAVERRRVLGSAVLIVERMQTAGELTAPRAKSLVQQLKNAIVRSRLQSWAAQAADARAARDHAREIGIWRRAMEDAAHLPADEAAAHKQRLQADIERAEFEGRLRAMPAPKPATEAVPPGAEPEGAEAEPEPAPAAAAPAPRNESTEFEISWDSGLAVGAQGRAPFRTSTRRGGGR